MNYRTLTSKIAMERKPMKNLSESTQAYVCTCEERCETYIHLDDYGRYCENDALEIAYNLFALAKSMRLPKPKPRKFREWSSDEIRFIKDWCDNKGFQYGDRRVIAEILGRDYRSVRHKIDHMVRLGDITISSTGYSKHRGVSFSKAQGKWVAYAPVDENGKRKFLGYFKEEEDAIQAAQERWKGEKVNG